MDTFVNPIPGIKLEKMFAFDFPLGSTSKDYQTPGCKRNVDLNNPNGQGETPTSEVPTQEGIYGKLGNPKRHQGFPSVMEWPTPEAEDPDMQDQIVDIDREACFDHTGRLSGSFVKYLVQANHHSNVKMTVVPLTHGNGSPVLIWESGFVALVPQAAGPNKWYWEDIAKQNELIFTAHAVINPQKWQSLNLKPGIYKLVINWEFWAATGKVRERMPISGFDESVSFELSAPTIDL
ncbi:MAG: hypothetical protein ACOY90_20315 [Candidatus Zhuqueibacterota bacterium]